MLLFLLIKFSLFKLIVKCLPDSLKKHFKITWEKFYHHFSLELTCFVPFFAISAFSNVLEFGETSFIGILNSVTQILTLIMIIIVPAFSLSMRFFN